MNSMMELRRSAGVKSTCSLIEAAADRTSLSAQNTTPPEHGRLRSEQSSEELKEALLLDQTTHQLQWERRETQARRSCLLKMRVRGS